MSDQFANLPQYRCHKVVRAVKIARIDDAPVSVSGSPSTLVPCDAIPPFEISSHYRLKHNPQSGGYFVVYEDGYQSFSPAEAFESGYTLINPHQGASLRAQIRGFTGDALRDEIDKLFDYATDGFPAAYFEFPFGDKFEVARVVYSVIACRGSSVGEARDQVVEKLKQLRLAVPNGKKAWLFWRRSPKCAPVYPATLDLESISADELEDIEPEQIEVSVRIAVPGTGLLP